MSINWDFIKLTEILRIYPINIPQIDFITLFLNKLTKIGGADKKLDFLSDPIIPSELHRT